MTPGLSIYGDVNDLDFYGDEELFVNPVPSTSAGSSKPPAAIPDGPKPSAEPVNLLADLIACQTNFLTKPKQALTSKMKEVYTKPDIKEETKIISTSTSR